ncbi:MAG: serine/threonine protein kinase [Oscillospiraceae bacterium]|nr:serine/threonine protein kinase [Oscillospiraceae bacterium]
MYGKTIKPGSYIYRTYRIVEKLGSGGSGAVYLAWHTRLRKHVVIKLVKNCSASTVETRRNEVEALKKIRNMYVPQVLDFLVENDHSFTVIEHIEGESFDKLLKQKKRFDESKVVQWYKQLTSALCAIHRYDVCHRDIKPANILLTTNGDVCLIDFNFAFVSGNNTGVISRSMGYASPEQYEYFKLCRSTFTDNPKTGDNHMEASISENDGLTELVRNVKKSKVPEAGKNKHEDESSQSNNHEIAIDWKLSDIYSLGATIYHLLTGNRPPVVPDEVAKIPNLTGYSNSILKIIENSMKTNPTQRFKSAAELSKMLDRVYLCV